MFLTVFMKRWCQDACLDRELWVLTKTDCYENVMKMWDVIVGEHLTFVWQLLIESFGLFYVQTRIIVCNFGNFRDKPDKPDIFLRSWLGQPYKNRVFILAWFWAVCDQESGHSDHFFKSGQNYSSIISSRGLIFKLLFLLQQRFNKRRVFMFYFATVCSNFYVGESLTWSSRNKNPISVDFGLSICCRKLSVSRFIFSFLV